MKYAYVIALTCTALIETSCAKHAAQPRSTQTPSAVATLLIESKGVTMPLPLAVRSLQFRPFMPRADVVQVAVIPPLNVNQQKNHGLAIEYVAGGKALLLSQWPRAGVDFSSSALDFTRRPCAPVAFKADGLIWTTRNGLVMTLQPDGTAPPSRIAHEAQQLIADGACGSAARTFSPRRSRTRTPAVSLPRQSVS